MPDTGCHGNVRQTMHLQSVSTIFISFAFLCINHVVASTEGTVHLNCQGIKYDGQGNSQRALAGYAIQTRTVDGYPQSRVLAEEKDFQFSECRRDALQYVCGWRGEVGVLYVTHQLTFNRSSGSVSQQRLTSPKSTIVQEFSFEGQCEVSDDPKF